jgi:AraC-like DNA-binding protein
MSDPFSDVLELIGVKSSVYFQKDFRAPWGMHVSDTGFAQFHILVRGTAIIVYGTETIDVSAGDIVLFPRGATHLICDRSQSVKMSGQDVLSAVTNGEDPFAEGDITARMICGHFEYDFGCTHPILEELPDIMILRASESPMMSQLVSLVQLIIWETSTKAPGSDVVVRRLSDGLLVSVLRAYYETEKPGFGFYEGLSDARLRPALQAIHNSEGSIPDVTSLATLAGMSRSSFLQHFKSKVGQSAGAYASAWRLLKARAAVGVGSATIENIAIDAGYNSASAFTRAFQNHFGQTPSDFRKSSRRQ